MKTLPLLLPVMAVLSCQGKSVSTESDVSAAVRSIPKAQLVKVAQKRIYFGHQSVGYNMVEGLDAIVKAHPEVGLKVVESRSPADLASPAFIHGTNGRNHEPSSKIQAFASAMEKEGLGATTDIALFKFCYVDFPPGTDVEKVFAEYKGTLARLRQAFPKVRFVHVTSPVTVVQSGPKALLKKMLGRPLGGAEANVTREAFNALMRKEYADKEPILDLAAVESRLPDGRTVTFQANGKSYPALADEYASDGKHLTAAGGQWAALHLLQTLASAAD